MVPTGFKISFSLASSRQDSSCPFRLARFSWQNQTLEKFYSFGVKPTEWWTFPTLIDGLKLRFNHLESRRIKVQQDVPDCKLQGSPGRIPELASNPNNVESVCGRSDLAVSMTGRL